MAQAKRIEDVSSERGGEVGDAALQAIIAVGAEAPFGDDDGLVVGEIAQAFEPAVGIGAVFVGIDMPGIGGARVEHGIGGGAGKVMGPAAAGAEDDIVGDRADFACQMFPGGLEQRPIGAVGNPVPVIADRLVPEFEQDGGVLAIGLRPWRARRLAASAMEER